jgi:hypothetical protein
MRPVRVTGVVGTSAWVPIDTYSPAQANVTLTGAGAVEITIDNVFDTSITPAPIVLTLVSGGAVVPPGVRAVRATGMAAPDILTVSQQGIA